MNAAVQAITGPGTFIGVAFASFSSQLNFQDMQAVESSAGFVMMNRIEYFEHGVWNMGALMAIGENVKRHGEHQASFTAFLVARQDSSLLVCDIKGIRHSPEKGLPELWTNALRAGWKIVPCSCACGGKFAWFAPRPSGAHEMFGCVCHSAPVLQTNPATVAA